MSMYYDSVTKAVIVPSESSPTQTSPSATSESNVKQNSTFLIDHLKKESIQFARVGGTFFKRGLFDEAAEAFSKAIEKYHAEPLYFGNRALCFLELGDYERAAADCETALQLGPKSVKFYYRHALALYGLGSITKSIQSLLHAYSLALGSAKNRSDDIDSLCEEIDEIKERIDFFSQSLSNDDRELVDQQVAKIEKENQLPTCNRNSTSTDESHESVFSCRKLESTNENDPYADPTNPLQAYMLWIGNFSGPNATEKELKRLLKTFGGKTLSCTVFPQTSCALVTLQSAHATGLVMSKLQGYDFHGTSLLVRYKMRAGEKAPIPTRERRRENSWTSPWRRTVPSEGESQAYNSIEADYEEEEFESEQVSDQNGTKPKAKPLFGQPGESRTVWVGKLSEECTEGDLRKLLSAAGPVCRVNLLSATRCAFVEFGDPDSAEAAVRAFSGRRFFGKIIRLNLACDLVSTTAKLKQQQTPSIERTTSESGAGDLSRESLSDTENVDKALLEHHVPEESSPGRQQTSSSLPNGSVLSHDSNIVDDDGRDFKALWLGSLDDPTLTEADILRIFQKYRPISANVITKTSCGFVNFRTENDAADARRELNGVVIAGNSKRPMRIEFKVIGGFNNVCANKTTPQQQQQQPPQQPQSEKSTKSAKAHSHSTKSVSRR